MTDESLFREEALAAQQHKSRGTVTLYCPPYRWVNVALITTVALSALLFFIFGSYTKRETASGTLVPSEGVMGIMPNEAGRVDKIYVKEGQSVKKGTILVDVSPDVSTNLGPTREMIAQQLALQQLQAQSDLDGLAVLKSERHNGLLAQEKMLRQQMVQLRSQQQHRERQVALAHEKLNKIIQMKAQGYAANAQVEQEEGNLLEANVRVQESNRQQLEVQQQLAKVQQELREHPINSQRYENEVAQRIAQLKQSVAENESRRLVTLVAPKDGFVAAILADVGQVVGGRQSVLTLLPSGSELQARVMVPSRAIGFIKPGQKVVLRYRAYPYQKFGQQHGTVTSISRTALTPQELVELTGTRNWEEGQYRVSVVLDRQDVAVYGRTEPLHSGTELEADFLLENRRLIEWVLEPLYALGKRYLD
ncbi:MAG: HlyD family efflux transporter periplasmic adaptor subunit [Neisseriaceae bacterium]|nr:HlyD family efflux transporter periplasmic adaptor subunit [Neisseriaceae bacterium]